VADSVNGNNPLTLHEEVEDPRVQLADMPQLKEIAANRF